MPDFRPTAINIPVVSDIRTIASQFTFLNNVIITELKPYRFPPTFPDAGLGYNGALGHPVICDLTFQQATYPDPATGNNVVTPALRIETVIMTITQTKNIVKTTIQGRNGTVKEYIGDGDYMVDINLVITSNANGQYPRDEVGDLIRILKAPVSIPVTSWYLQQLGIDYLTIEKLQLPTGARRPEPTATYDTGQQRYPLNHSIKLRCCAPTLK